MRILNKQALPQRVKTRVFSLHSVPLLIDHCLDIEHRVVAKQPTTLFDFPARDVCLDREILERAWLNAVAFDKVPIDCLRAILEICHTVLIELIGYHSHEIVIHQRIWSSLLHVRFFYRIGW